MLKRKNRNIKLAEVPNRHVLVWGNSGMGKTYFCCRKIEEDYDNNKKILILDYSGSYTDSELKRACFDIPTLTWNPYKTPLYWSVNALNKQDFVDCLFDILATVFKICDPGYWQPKILSEVLSLHLRSHNYFSFAEFFDTLEDFLKLKQFEEAFGDEISNAERLLGRFYIYRKIDKLFICMQNDKPRISKHRVLILQLSDFSTAQRRLLTTLFSELLWLEAKRKNGQHCYDTLLFDEFQHLSLVPDRALCHFLREGRKYGVGLLLSSQFVSTYRDEELEILFQVGNILVFRPNDHDMKFSAQKIDCFKAKDWLEKLENLKIGEAVLRGHYYLENRTKLLTLPTICEIARKERR